MSIKLSCGSPRFTWTKENLLMNDQQDDLDALRLMRWEPKYYGHVPNKNAPGGTVDMWLMVDDETGEGIVTLGVPTGRSDIAGYVAACCGNPVRWVTRMWRPDPRADGIDDPDGILHRETQEISDALFRSYMAWLDENKVQPNGWTLSDALAMVWFAFCGQLSHDMRGRLLFKFLSLATTDVADQFVKDHSKGKSR
jgi:hypothetical protein